MRHYCTSSERFLMDEGSSRCPIRGSMRRKTSRGSRVMRHGPRQTLSRAILSTIIFSVSALAILPPDASYVASFNKWKSELVDDLKQNWLVLAGLFWLKPGANTFGSANDNAIVLPAGPAHAGIFTLQGDDVSVELQPGVDAKIGGQLQNSSKLAADITGKPTVIE